LQYSFIMRSLFTSDRELKKVMAVTWSGNGRVREQLSVAR
jgi:hypothetical protein